MTGVQTCALPICFPVTIWGLTERQFLNEEVESVDALQFFKDLQLGFIDIEAMERETEKGMKFIDVFTMHNVNETQLIRFFWQKIQAANLLILKSYIWMRMKPV